MIWWEDDLVPSSRPFDLLQCTLVLPYHCQPPRGLAKEPTKVFQKGICRSPLREYIACMLWLLFPCYIILMSGLKWLSLGKHVSLMFMMMCCWTTIDVCYILEAILLLVCEYYRIWVKYVLLWEVQCCSQYFWLEGTSEKWLEGSHFLSSKKLSGSARCLGNWKTSQCLCSLWNGFYKIELGTLG